MPNSVQMARSREQLRVLFGCQQAPLPENCGMIWRHTAEVQLRELYTRAQACEIRAPADREPVSHRADLPCVSGIVWLHALPLPSCLRTWQNWEKSADAALEQRLAPESAVGVVLPADFQPHKPDLYHVNRVLTGEEPNESLWLSQLVRFLCGFCCKRNLRLLLKTDCSVDRLSALPRAVSRQTGLPDLIWMPADSGQWNALLVLAELVMASRGECRKGIPPVLFAYTDRVGDSIPQSLCVRVNAP